MDEGEAGECEDQKVVKESIEIADAKATEVQRQLEQLASAQSESYEANVAERKAREARDRERIVEGDLEPLMDVNADFMESALQVEAMFDWLSTVENRSLLYQYLTLQQRAVRWYADHAETYFASCSERLQTALQDSPTLRAFFQDETAKLEDALFNMPEKGRFVPRLFTCPVNEELSQRSKVEIDD
eukprot:5716485-Amphidinium_carterae.1